jgi:hypothetical protein
MFHRSRSVSGVAVFAALIRTLLQEMLYGSSPSARRQTCIWRKLPWAGAAGAAMGSQLRKASNGGVLMLPSMASAGAAPTLQLV